MEGPTPVSALLHAATMVTAGVFLVVRFSILFEYCPLILKIIVFIGSFTALFSSLIGSFQYDIKKIIAYSTCSQLGYMFVGCGLSQYNLALFHLFNHAFFKALLFLSSGLVIHSIHTQDIRNMRKTKQINSLIIILFLIPSLSLCGFPFLSGSLSKELIINISSNSYLFKGDFIYFMLLLAACMTLYYSIKLIFFVLTKNKFFFSNNFMTYYNNVLRLDFNEENQDPSDGSFLNFYWLRNYNKGKKNDIYYFRFNIDYIITKYLYVKFNIIKILFDKYSLDIKKREYNINHEIIKTYVDKFFKRKVMINKTHRKCPFSTLVRRITFFVIKKFILFIYKLRLVLYVIRHYDRKCYKDIAHYVLLFNEYIKCNFGLLSITQPYSLDNIVKYRIFCQKLDVNFPLKTRFPHEVKIIT